MHPNSPQHHGFGLSSGKGLLYAECRNNPQGKAAGLLISFHIMPAVELGLTPSLVPPLF